MNAELQQFFKFNSGQRKGIFGLFLSIILLQVVLLFADFSQTGSPDLENQQWLSLQPKMDSLKALKQNIIPAKQTFNPNYITDFKANQLGLQPIEFDRLQAFRKTEKYVNSAQEFQAVTKISNQLLAKISPLFKFPDWVNKKNINNNPSNNYVKFPEKEKIKITDINLTTKEELMKISGIGEAISDRILAEREKLTAFVDMQQIQDIYGLTPEVIEKINQNFKIASRPNIKKININNATLKELAQFLYFKNGLAKKIIIHRSMNGDFKNPSDLNKVKDFPV